MFPIPSKLMKEMREIEDGEADEELHTPFLRSNARPRLISRGRWATRFFFSWIWVFSTFLFAFIALEGYLQNRKISMTGEAKLQGLRSELEAARGTIEYHDIIFTSGIEEDENGKMFLNLPADQPHYVGAPSPEIDAAWADLTKATEIWVDGDEARSVANRTIGSEHGWLVSLDVYHSLHCVNLARKGFDWDYYYGDGPGQERITYITRDHIYHCLEHLRQVAMCHGDLTPMRFQWGENRGMPVWTEPHTCRSFEQIRAWAEQRRRNPGKALTHGHHGH